MPKISQHKEEEEDEKKVRKTTYEKDDDGFLIGIDMRNQKELHEISKLVEKKEAKRLDRYIMGVAFYWCKHKLNT